MVDTTLDKLILEAISLSEEIITPEVVDDEENIVKEAELLSNIPTFFIGDKKMQKAPERIVIGKTTNRPAEEGFDCYERKITFGFHLQIKDTLDYIRASDRINDIENALIRTMRNSELLSDYNDQMSVDDINPIYQNDEDDNIIFQTEEIYISFVIQEDYTQDETSFDRIKYTGDMI